MMDINMIIADNILEKLNQLNKKQVDLADGIGVSEQTMSKMLNGRRAINAFELKKIADYLGISMDSLVNVPAQSIPKDVVHTFMDRVETGEAREALQIADKVSDLILFHKKVRKNGVLMTKPIEE